MGRHRRIDRDAVLDAAERVVASSGAARLTLEAVAAEAGISKASVLYDYKTKRELIRAVIERRAEAENRRLQTYIDALGGAPDAAIRGRLAGAAEPISSEERTVAISLCSALAQDPELQAPIRDAIRMRVAEIRSASTAPRGAMLAFLATEGLMLLEWFSLAPWSEAERAALIADIGWLIGQQPDAAEEPSAEAEPVTS